MESRFVKTRRARVCALPNAAHCGFDSTQTDRGHPPTVVFFNSTAHTMKHVHLRLRTHRLQCAATALLGAAALAGCASPYPPQKPVQLAQATPQTVYVYPDGSSNTGPGYNPAYDYRRRSNEILYQADVLSARMVVGQSGQRCWIERSDVAPERAPANMPGALAGAVIGGILGHQIGNGTGRDLATVGGVVAGAAVGSNVGRDRNGRPLAQDVQRCTGDPAGATPDYWDVTYQFRGVTHRAQMTTPPGPTVTVNAAGEPRI